MRPTHDVETRWGVTIVARDGTELSANLAFNLSVELEVDVYGQPFFRRAWREAIERRLA